MANLLTLCWFHHTSLHKGEYRINLEKNDDVVFVSKWNKIISQTLYPQFPNNPTVSDHLTRLEADNQELDLNTDEHTTESKWLGEHMDIQQALAHIHELYRKAD